MTDPKEWAEADLKQLIAEGREESLELDYKACDALQNTDGKKNDVSKDVSSFANAVGGTILYGMRERDHKPESIDIGYDPTEITKEWVEQVINSRIHPRIDGLVVRPIPLNNGKQAYAVCIPASDRAPHQASDKRYYKRYNFESVPMEDYEVRDVMFRQRVPVVRLSGEIVGFAHRLGPHEAASAFAVGLRPEIENAGRSLARHCAVELRFSSLWHERIEFGDKSAVRYRKEGEELVMTLLGYGPLFPSQKGALYSISVKIPLSSLKTGKPLVISVTVYADDMPARRCEYNLLMSATVRSFLTEQGLGHILGQDEREL